MQNLPFIINDDDRRTLYEWIENETFCSAKVVVIKKRLPAVGDHFHNNKDEIFFLLTGRFEELHLGEGVAYNIPAPYKVEVRKGVYHKFIFEPGSILLGVASKPFDPNDEIKKE